MRVNARDRRTFASSRAAGLLCLAWAVLVPASARAQQWTYAASDHFEVYTTGGERRARAALTYFERVHAFFEDVLNLSPVQKVPTRLIVFSSAREYAPYRLNEFATAYYRSGPDRDHIVMQSLDAESYPVVVHEYAHLIMRHSGARFPAWLNEGLAEFYSTISPVAGQMSLGRVPMGRLNELRYSGELFDLPRLFAVDSRSAEYTRRSHAGTFYAQSWALTHMILTGDGYREGSGRFMAAMSGGKPSAQAIEEVYGRPLTDVLGDLRRYIGSDRFAYFTTKYREPRTTSTVPVRRVEPFEARLVTATLLSGAPDRDDEARAAYEALLQERPSDVGVLEARAYLELRAGNNLEAQAFLLEAIKGKSRNPMVYRWASMLASSDAERETWLAEAVAIDPDDVETRLMYAHALHAIQKPEEALAALASVPRLTPEQAFPFFQLQARLNVQLNRLDEAQAAAAQARSHASAGAETAAIEQLMQAINDYADRRAAAERMMRETGEPPAGTTARAAGVTEPAAGAPDDDLWARARANTRATAPGEGLLTIIQGRIQSLDCAATPVLMRVATEAGDARLVIDDTLGIRVLGADGPTTDLACGPQDRPVRIGYDPNPDPARKTLGAIRLLDFR